MNQVTNGSKMLHRMRRFTCIALYCSLCAVGLTATSVMGGEGEAGGTLIVLNKGEASASLLGRGTGKEFARLPTGDGPHEVAVSPDGKIAVVADYGEREPGSTLTVIDLVGRSVRSTIDLGRFQRPHGILFMPDGRRVVVTAERQKALLIVDIESESIVKDIDTTQEISHMVAMTPDARRAFVPNIRSGTVSVIDLVEGTLLKVIETGAGAEGVDVTPDGREVWVTNRAADTVTILDARSLEVLSTLECTSFPIRLKFTPDGRHALVSNARSGDVAVFDVKTRKEFKRIPMEVEARRDVDDRLFRDRFGESPVPVGILIPPDGRQAYVANTNADIVTVIDLKSWEVVDRLTAGREPDGLGYTPLRLTD